MWLLLRPCAFLCKSQAAHVERGPRTLSSNISPAIVFSGWRPFSVRTSLPRWVRIKVLTFVQAHTLTNLRWWVLREVLRHVFGHSRRTTKHTSAECCPEVDHLVERAADADVVASLGWERGRNGHPKRPDQTSSTHTSGGAWQGVLPLWCRLLFQFRLVGE